METGHKNRLSKGKIVGIGSQALSVGLLVVLVMVMALSALVCEAAPAAQRIKSISVADQKSSVEITISAAMPISLTTPRVSNSFVAFDVRGTILGDRNSRMVNSGGIRSVVFGPYKSDPAMVRIVANCTSGYHASKVKYADGKRTAFISIMKNGVTGSNQSVKKNVTPVLPAMAGLAGNPVLVASNAPVAIPVTMAKAAVDRVSLDFVGSDIHDVIKALAMQTGANIMAGPEVKGNVTASLKNVTVEEALRLVTNMSGYKFARINDTYVIGSASRLQSMSSDGLDANGDDRNIVSAVVVRYSDIKAMMKLIQDQYPSVKSIVDRNFQSRSTDNTAGGGNSSGAGSGSKGVVTPRGATMIVLNGPEGDVNAARRTVENIESCMSETAKEQVIDIYEVRFSNAREVRKAIMTYVPGVEVAESPGAYDFNRVAAKMNPNMTTPFSTDPNQAILGGWSAGATATQAETSNESGSSSDDPKDDKKSTPALMNRLILLGRAEDVAKAKELAAKIDVPETQIMLEAKIVDLNTDDSKDLGIEWTWDKFDIGETDRVTGEITLGRFHRTPAEIQATVHAMIESGRGKVLATPNVCILDGKQASIFIGDEITYVSLIQNTTVGQNVETRTQDVGVGLLALCRASTDGYVTMSLHPEVSVITGYLDSPGGGKLPQVATRKLSTVVRVKDGETIVLGGLLKDDEIETMAKLPILSDLPLVGGLFKRKTTSKTHSEVVMFITPRILSNDK